MLSNHNSLLFGWNKDILNHLFIWLFVSLFISFIYVLIHSFINSFIYSLMYYFCDYIYVSYQTCDRKEKITIDHSVYMYQIM